MRTAYLNAFLVTTSTQAMPVTIVSDVGIYSSPPHRMTLMSRFGIWANLMEVEAETFQEAHDKIVEIVNSYDRLRWVMPWISQEKEISDARWLLRSGPKSPKEEKVYILEDVGERFNKAVDGFCTKVKEESGKYMTKKLEQQYSPIEVAIALALYGYNVSAYQRASKIYEHFNGNCPDMGDLEMYMMEYGSAATAMPFPSAEAYVDHALEKYGEEAKQRVKLDQETSVIVEQMKGRANRKGQGNTKKLNQEIADYEANPPRVAGIKVPWTIRKE